MKKLLEDEAIESSKESSDETQQTSVVFVNSHIFYIAARRIF